MKFQISSPNDRAQLNADYIFYILNLKKKSIFSHYFPHSRRPSLLICMNNWILKSWKYRLWAHITQNVNGDYDSLDLFSCSTEHPEHRIFGYFNLSTTQCFLIKQRRVELVKFYNFPLSSFIQSSLFYPHLYINLF